MQDTPRGREWVRLLRSGEWRQGYGRLKERGWTSDGKYCCLGVLVEGVLGDECNAQIMPLSHQIDRIGLTPDEAGACSGFNDTDRLNFRQIATILERSMNDGITVQMAYAKFMDEYGGVIPSTVLEAPSDA